MEPRTPDDIQATGTLPVAGQGAVPVGSEPEVPAPSARPDWVEEARAGLAAPGKYLAFEVAGQQTVVPVEREWTRIGRSLAADVRFDDATVSRRHALVVNQPEGVRVLDDRSLNGVFVNHRRVEWSPLGDGDVVTIGRHALWFLDTSAVKAGAPSAPAAVAE